VFPFKKKDTALRRINCIPVQYFHAIFLSLDTNSNKQPPLLVVVYLRIKLEIVIDKKDREFLDRTGINFTAGKEGPGLALKTGYFTLTDNKTGELAYEFGIKGGKSTELWFDDKTGKIIISSSPKENSFTLTIINKDFTTQIFTMTFKKPADGVRG
jgi:hypothetical protein